MTTLLIASGTILLLVLMLRGLFRLDNQKEEKVRRESKIRTYDKIAKKNDEARLKNWKWERE